MKIKSVTLKFSNTQNQSSNLTLLYGQVEISLQFFSAIFLQDLPEA